jgi:hypothetical protein
LSHSASPNAVLKCIGSPESNENPGGNVAQNPTRHRRIDQYLKLDFLYYKQYEFLKRLTSFL